VEKIDSMYVRNELIEWFHQPAYDEDEEETESVKNLPSSAFFPFHSTNSISVRALLIHFLNESWHMLSSTQQVSAMFIIFPPFHFFHLHRKERFITSLLIITNEWVAHNNRGLTPAKKIT
jgi:hypothetical protein